MDSETGLACFCVGGEKRSNMCFSLGRKMYPLDEEMEGWEALTKFVQESSFAQARVRANVSKTLSITPSNAHAPSIFFNCLSCCHGRGKGQVSTAEPNADRH